MEAALDRIQFKYSLTDRQRKLLQFSFIGIIYDSTKFLMLFIFFACIEQVPAYIFCSLLLILLRSNQGGLHLKHYTSCFVLSFFYLFSAIAIFPDIFTDIPQSVGLIILFICMLINYSAGPQKNKKIYKITNDHTLVNLLVASGELTKEQAQHHPRKNVLMRALGASISVEMDVFDVETDIDGILLCSDGLTNMLDETSIEAVLDSDMDIDSKTQKLINKANNRGGTDNISVAYLQKEEIK